MNWNFKKYINECHLDLSQMPIAQAQLLNEVHAGLASDQT